MATQALADPAQKKQQAAFWRIITLLSLSAIISTFTSAYTTEKTTILYKEVLGLSPGDVGTLNLFLSIPAYLQPFIGIWCDLVPLFGYHRRSYFVIAALIVSAGNLGLALLPQYHYLTVALLVLTRVFGAVIVGVILNAVSVAIGNATGRFGQMLAALGFIPLVLTIAYTGHLGGTVTQEWSYHKAFLYAAVADLLRVPLIFLLDDRRVMRSRQTHETEKEHEARDAARQADRARIILTLRRTMKEPGLWAIVGFIFYLILTPGIYTAQVYYELDVLHFSKQLIGDLTKWQAGGQLLGGLFFLLASRRMSARVLVWGAWAMDALSYPALLLLHDAQSARILSLLGGAGIVGVLYGLFLNTLAARATPRGIEGTIYGLIQSAIVLAGNLSEKIGGSLYDYFGPKNPTHHYSIAHGWTWALWFGFAFTVIGFVFIPFLPAWAKTNEPIRPLPDPEPELAAV